VYASFGLSLGAAVFVGHATGARFAPHGVTRYHLIVAYIVAPQAVAADSLSVRASVGAISVRVHEERELFSALQLERQADRQPQRRCSRRRAAARTSPPRSRSRSTARSDPGRLAPASPGSPPHHRDSIVS
jgi:hypothetical protein